MVKASKPAQPRPTPPSDPNSRSERPLRREKEVAAADPERMAAEVLVTSLVAGLSFVIATVVFGFFGGLGIQLANTFQTDRPLKLVLVGVGLAVALGLITYLLLGSKQRLLNRSRAWYRGAWIGVILSLVIMVLMYYFPWIALPEYCPPGAPCEVSGVR